MDIEFPLPEIRLSAELSCLHKPGAVRLDGYPRLVYAPAQHGREVRTEDHGVKVSDIVVAFAATPDPETVAAAFGTSPEHVAEAVRYAVEAGAAAVASPEG